MGVNHAACQELSAACTVEQLRSSGPAVGRWIEFDLDLPMRETDLTWRHLRTRVRFRGDEAVAMDDYGTDLTFFEPFE